jgi:hypothetical protein
MQDRLYRLRDNSFASVNSNMKYKCPPNIADQQAKIVKHINQPLIIDMHIGENSLTSIVGMPNQT